MALSRTSEIGEFHFDNVGSTTIASSSFTPPANSLLVVSIDVFIDADDTAGLGISGGGLTYTLRSGVVRSDNGGFAPSDYPIFEMWTAPVGGSPSSMQVTITFPSGSTIILMDMHIVAYTGYNVGSPIGATGSFNNTFNTTGQDDSESITLNASPASTSFVFASMHCGANSAAGPITQGVGWTEIYDFVSNDSGALGFQSQERTSSTSTTVSWADVDTNNGSAGMWGCCGFAMEIKQATTDTTLTADAGSYTITGTAVGLLYNRRLSAGAGSYSLTGTTAGVFYGRRVLAGVGSYSLTGSTANLLRGRVLSGQSGSYSISGSNAGLLVGRKLTAQGGSYTINGSDATLTKVADKVINAVNGSYNVSGTSENLLLGRLLLNDGGVFYSLNGSNVNLLKQTPNQHSGMRAIHPGEITHRTRTFKPNKLV